MEDKIKELLYKGIGLAASTAEKIKENIDSLVEDGSINNDEAKRMMDEFKKSASETGETVSNKVKEFFDVLKDKYEKETSSDTKQKVDDFAKKAEEVKTQAEEKFKDFASNVKEKFNSAASSASAAAATGFASKEDKLKARIKDLKDRLAKYEDVEEEE